MIRFRASVLGAAVGASLIIIGADQAARASAAGRETAPIQGLKTITMRRENHCAIVIDPRDLRQCPDFTIAVDFDATVTYDGRRGVRVLGHATHRADPVDVRRLFEEFDEVNFFSLEDEYRFVDLGNGRRQMIDHGRTTRLTFAAPDRSKTVVDFYGTPFLVRRLQQRVENVTDVERYTGRAAPDPFFPR